MGYICATLWIEQLKRISRNVASKQLQTSAYFLVRSTELFLAARGAWRIHATQIPRCVVRCALHRYTFLRCEWTYFQPRDRSLVHKCRATAGPLGVFIETGGYFIFGEIIGLLYEVKKQCDKRYVIRNISKHGDTQIYFYLYIIWNVTPPESVLGFPKSSFRSLPLFPKITIGQTPNLPDLFGALSAKTVTFYL